MLNKSLSASQLYNINKFISRLNTLINEHIHYKNEFENLDCLAIASLFDIRLPGRKTGTDGHMVGVMEEEVTELNFPILDFDVVLYNNKIYYIDITTRELKLLDGYDGASLETVKQHLDSINTNNPYQKLFCVHDKKNKIAFLLKIQLINIISGGGIEIKKIFYGALLNEYLIHNCIKICDPSLSFRVYHLLLSLVMYRDKFMCTIDLERWRLCLKHIFALLHLIGEQNLLLNDLQLYNYAKAIKYFKKLKCAPVYFLGEIDLNINKTKKHLKMIERKILKDIKETKNFYIFILVKLEMLIDSNTNRVVFKRTFNDYSSKYTIRTLIPDQPILANILYIKLNENKEITQIRCLDDNRQEQEMDAISKNNQIYIQNKHNCLSIKVATNSLTLDVLCQYLTSPPSLDILVNIGFYTPQIEPFGLALKFAVQHYGHLILPLSIDDYIKCQQVFDLITHYCNLFQLLDVSMWDSCANIENIIRNMHFDQYYTLPQLPSRFFISTIKIFKDIELDDQFSEKLNVLNYLFERYSQCAPHKIAFSDSAEFGAQSLYKTLSNISSQFVENSYLSNWNQDTSSFNNISLSISFQKKMNHYHSEVFFINHPCLNLLFVEYLLNNAKSEYIIASDKAAESAEKEFGDKFGKAFESVISDALTAHNVEHFHALRYHRSRNCQLTVMWAESDIIVETPTHILLFECKTKQLSHAARSGDNLSLIMDIYSGFLHSQYQACRTKHLLTTQGFITFDNDVKILHNNRTIVTISVAFLDSFQSLMDKHYIRGMFEFFANREFTATEQLSDQLSKSFKKFNQILCQFRHMGLHSYTSDMFFLSFQQVLTILEYSTNNNEFVKNLLLDPLGGKCLYGYKDWFVDFYQTKKFR